MNLLKSSFTAFLLAACAIPALAGITVNTPSNGAAVSPQFTLSAVSTTCSSQPVTAMGFSLDSSANTTVVKSTSMDATVTATTGTHTVHVKAWGNAGASCVTDVAVTSMGYSIDSGATTISSGISINTQTTAAAGQHTLHVKAWNNAGAVCTADVAIDVLGVSSPGNSVVPSKAISVSSIQALNNWQAQNDPGTGAPSSGSTSLVSSPSLSGNARRFDTSFSNSGGELYHISFADDTAVANFFFDTWIYLTSSASSIANIEMDMNQVMSNGQTVIYGFQCDGYSGSWDFTENAGSPTSPSDQWVHSGAACNPRTWAQNTWHHIQISYSRDSVGNVTYHAVWFDGVEQPINATVPSAFALGWGPVLLTNFQIDGLGSGSNTVYLDQLTISRW